MKFKKCIFIFSFILLSFILLFSNICFASEPSYPSFDSVLDNTYSHYGYVVWTRDGEYQMALIRANSEDTINNIYAVTNSHVHIGSYKSVVGDAYYFRYRCINGVWTLQETYTLTEGNLVEGRMTWNELVDSTFNIYNHTDGTIFFQKTPVEQITLAEIMKTAGHQATVEVTQIILTVMKITAGLIACVIGFKAGWKFFRDGWWC